MRQASQSSAPTLILASGSPARAEMLRNAGIDFRADPVKMDEHAVRLAMVEDDAPARDVADTLAELKSRRSATRNPEAIVIGADQVLECEGRLFSKPATLEDVREQLRQLQGRTHVLYSAAVAYENGAPVWRHVGTAKLFMRRMTEEEEDAYMRAEGDALLSTVGCYRLEAHGIHLFSAVRGDWFTILGLPLLELLAFLRTRGIGLA